MLGSDRIVSCLCECRDAQLKKEKQEREQKETFDRIRRLQKAGFADESLRLCRFETDASPDSYISVVARNYVSNFRKMLADGKST